MDNRAIGVFDSGVGGLTAVKELLCALPNENIIYFGDTARVPYGSHDKDTIINFSKQDLSFLISKNVKTILVACGTASSTALPVLQSMTKIPVLGVVKAAALDASSVTKRKRILVLATAATVRSHSYAAELHAADPTVTVREIACPLFVPLIENGYINKGNKVTQMVVAEYLSGVKEFGADTVILGCTHYPLIKHFITRELGDVNIIEAGKSAVNSLKDIINTTNKRNDGKNIPYQKYYVSESIASFSSIARLFLGTDFKNDVNIINIDKF